MYVSYHWLSKEYFDVTNYLTESLDSLSNMGGGQFGQHGPKKQVFHEN